MYRKIHLNKPLRQLLQIFAMVCVAAISFIAWRLIHTPGFLPFKTLKITGDWQSVNVEKLEDKIKPLLQQGFFNIDIGQLQGIIEKMPWIKTVTIKRLWPHTLIIHIVRYQAVAEWNNHALLDQTGILFTPPKQTYPQHLLKITAPKGSNKRIFMLLTQFNNLLKPKKLSLQALFVSQRFAIR
ncbi:MAG: FtsQ-type POTRA domain-containing protein, partial [Pseudomonadota bacterium]